MEAPPPAPVPPRESPQAQKSRRGLARIAHALRYSLQGLRAGWQQTAFRTDCCLAAVLVPAAFVLGDGWAETGLLIASVALVLVVELLNSGIEAVVDRIGPEWHALSKQAKDMGSAAVLLALLMCGGLFAAALWHRIA